VDVAYTIKSTAGSTVSMWNGCMWLKPLFDNYYRYYQLLKLPISSVANLHRLALGGLK